MTAADDTTVIEFANGTKMEISKANYTKRVDLWADLFDGTYRLFMDAPHICELERKCSYVDRDGNQRARGIFEIYGAIAKGRYELEGRSVGFAVEASASLSECRETVRLALIGGGHALVDGEQIRVDAQLARRLVDNYLVPAPVEESWNLAYLMLHTVMYGRECRPEEIGVSIHKAVFPARQGSGDAAGDEPVQAEA